VVIGNRSRADRKPSLSRRIRTFSSPFAQRYRRRPINTVRDGGDMCEAARISASRTSKTAVHLEFRATSLSHPTNETNRDPDNNVALSTRGGRANTSKEPRLGPTARARACQSIIRIGLLKFLGTDGERMDIHSFGTLRKARELARSIPQSPRRIRTYAFRHTRRAYEEQPTRESGARHLIS